MTSTTEELRPGGGELREILAELERRWKVYRDGSTTSPGYSDMNRMALGGRAGGILEAIEMLRHIASAQPGVDVPKAGDKALDIMRRYRAGVFDPVLEKRSSIGILVEEIERLTDPIAWQLAKAPPAPVSDAVVEAALKIYHPAGYPQVQHEYFMRTMRAALQAAMPGKPEDGAQNVTLNTRIAALENEADRYMAALNRIAELDRHGGYNTACQIARAALSPSPSGGEGRS